MTRTSTLPGGCKSLSDTVHVYDVDGVELPPMTLAAAQGLAQQRPLRLQYLARDQRDERYFELIDEAALQRLRNQ
jgi:hypothetical protein